MTIWFDMDGTIADLYGVPGWLALVENSDTLPYEVAKPLVNLSKLARRLNQLQRMGHEIGIISWTSKTGSDSYNLEVACAKMQWLKDHLRSVRWNYLKIVAYGTDKRMTCGKGILFDDEARNRDSWGKGAYSPDQMDEILTQLVRG